MNLALVLAQILGIFFAVVGISMIIHKKTVAAAMEEITRDSGVLWLWGLLALIIGAVLVVFNNVWNFGLLPLFVTAIGWLALLKGIFILLFPGAAVALYKKCAKENMLMYAGYIVFILGVILLYQGFMYY
jgi:uncharacterized protein YjeT (DUF2065 family)